MTNITNEAPTVGAVRAGNTEQTSNHESQPCPQSIPRPGPNCNENVAGGLIIVERKDGFYADSRNVALWVGKEHNELLRDIRVYIDYIDHPDPESLDTQESAILGSLKSTDFFVPGKYKVPPQTRTYPMYYLTRKGCELVANKLTGRKGTLFTAAYITRFHQMEQLLELRSECPALTEAIAWRHEIPRHYHFSSEFDMINRIALGVKAKQFKIAHGIDPGTKSIRPYLTPGEANLISLLQRVDIGLLYAGLSTAEREVILRERAAQHGGRITRSASQALGNGRCQA